MKKIILFFAIASSVVLALTQESTSTATGRLETRASTGGVLLRGTERISPNASTSSVSAGVQLRVDGAAVEGWSAEAPMFDSTQVADGRHGFALEGGGESASASLLVLNGDGVAVHGGVLAGDETWSAEAVHVVRNWVRIPAGMTLTIAAGAVVKFCESTGIQNDGTLVAIQTTFTSIEDDAVGGDTDGNGSGANELGYGIYAITGEGAKTMDECTFRYLDGFPNDINSYTNVLDIRDSFGGWLVRGTAAVSRMAVEADAGAVIELATRAGEPAGGIDSREWDSTAVSDGLYTATLHEGENAYGATLAALNASNVAVHGGCMEADETWDAAKVHVVQYAVRVPSGLVLTIADDAVVKFCDGAGLLVDEGGQLSLGACVFTHVADDAHGGDTNLDGDESAPADAGYELSLGEPMYFSACSPKFFYAPMLSFCQTVVSTGCTEAEFQAVQDRKVTLAALLPEGEKPEFWKASWSSVPVVEFTAVDDLTATFTMPAEAVTVTCVLDEKPLEDRQLLRLAPGWNLVALVRPVAADDAERFLALRPITLDAARKSYLLCTAPDDLKIGMGYWVFSRTRQTLELKRDQDKTTWETAFLDSGWNLIGVADNSTWMDQATDVWQWLDGRLQKVSKEKLTAGTAYWVRQ